MEKYMAYQMVVGISEGIIKIVGSRDLRNLSTVAKEALNGSVCYVSELKEECIVLTEYISTSELLKVDPKIVKGFIIKDGNCYSNMIVLIRMLGIPAVMADEIIYNELLQNEGINVAINGRTGEIFLNPETDFLATQIKNDPHYNGDTELRAIADCEDITLYGKKLYVFANAHSVEDCLKAGNDNAKGVGLYRTEYDFMKMKQLPSEDELFHIYKEAVEAMHGKTIIFQLADFEDDKIPEYTSFYRLRRLNRSTDREWKKRQVRALLRVAEYGDVMLLIPRASSPAYFDSEVLELEFYANIMSEENKIIKPPPVGAMIENTMNEESLKALVYEAAFLGIDTNGLMAEMFKEEDYGTGAIKMFEFIRNVVKEAHAREKWVGIYGEIASDPFYLSDILDAGADIISVAPIEVLPMRRRIRNMDIYEEES